MTVKKAIQILEALSNHYDDFSKEWKEKSQSFNNPDMKEITRTLGDIMERDSLILKAAINELKPKIKSSKKSNYILSQELKKEIAEEVKREISRLKRKQATTLTPS